MIRSRTGSVIHNLIIPDLYLGCQITMDPDTNQDPQHWKKISQKRVFLPPSSKKASEHPAHHNIKFLKKNFLFFKSKY